MVILYMQTVCLLGGVILHLDCVVVESCYGFEVMMMLLLLVSFVVDRRGLLIVETAVYRIDSSLLMINSIELCLG